MGMSLRRVSGLFLVLSLAMPVAAAQESYWSSRPLSEWILDLGAPNADARVGAAHAIAQLAISHGVPR